MAWYLHAKTQILYALPSAPRNFPNGNVHEQNVWILMGEGGVVNQWVRGCPQDTHFFFLFNFSLQHQGKPQIKMSFILSAKRLGMAGFKSYQKD